MVRQVQAERDTTLVEREHDMKTVTVELKHQEHDILAQKVEDYFGGWHPFAYGTRLVRPAYYDEDQQCWVAVITRQTSCD